VRNLSILSAPSAGMMLAAGGCNALDLDLRGGAMFIYVCHTDAGTFVLEPHFGEVVEWNLSLDGRHLNSFRTASEAARSLEESGVGGISNPTLLPPSDLSAWVMQWCTPR
jgi:hypothetical protein